MNIFYTRIANLFFFIDKSCNIFLLNKEFRFENFKKEYWENKNASFECETVHDYLICDTLIVYFFTIQKVFFEYLFFS